MTARRALWVSTSMSTRGGVSSCVKAIRGTPLWEHWRVQHVTTHRDGSKPARALAFVRGLASYLVAVLVRRPDLVHLHMSSYGSFVRKASLALIARLLRLPVVLHVHGSEFALFYQRSSLPLRFAIRATLTGAAAVVALGERWAGLLRGIAPAARITVIPNSVPLGDPVSQPAGDEPVHVLFLGALGERKGTYTLLESWAQLTASGPFPARLTLAGDGEVERTRQTIARLGLVGSVELRSWLSREDAHEALRSAHVLVLPSRNEGQPMAVLEAMAHGLCVVASAAGGIPDLLDEQSGVLVPPDDVPALADALHQVVTDHGRRAELAAAAHERARRQFDVNVVWQRFDRLYRQVLGRPAQAPNPLPQPEASA